MKFFIENCTTLSLPAISPRVEINQKMQMSMVRYRAVPFCRHKVRLLHTKVLRLRFTLTIYMKMKVKKKITVKIKLKILIKIKIKIKFCIRLRLVIDND